MLFKHNLKFRQILVKTFLEEICVNRFFIVTIIILEITHLIWY